MGLTNKLAQERRAPPYLTWRDGFELPDDLYRRKLKLPKGGRRYQDRLATPQTRVLYLFIRCPVGPDILACLNTSNWEIGEERARPIVAKAVADGRIPTNHLAALYYARKCKTPAVCVYVDRRIGKYMSNIAKLDGGPGRICLDVEVGERGAEELAKDRLRVVVADWLARGLISVNIKPVKVYGPGGLDADFATEARRLAAEKWFANRCRVESSRATMYGAGVEALRPDREPIREDEFNEEIACLASMTDEAEREPGRKRLGLSLLVLNGLVTREQRLCAAEHRRRSAAQNSTGRAPPAQTDLDRVAFPAGLDRKAFTALKLEWLDDCAADPRITAFAFRVLQVMASSDLNRTTGTAWGGVDRYAEKVHGSARGVQKALASAEAAGKLRRDIGGGTAKGGRGRTNRYTPLVRGSGRVNGVHPSDGAMGEPGRTQRVNAVHPNSLDDSHKERDSRPSAATAPSPVLTDKKRRQRATGFKPVPLDWQPSEADIAFAEGEGRGADVDWLAKKFRLRGSYNERGISVAWGMWILNEWDPGRRRQRNGGSFTPKPRQPVATKDPNLSDDQWLKALIRFRKSQDWDPSLGPEQRPAPMRPRNSLN